MRITIQLTCFINFWVKTRRKTTHPLWRPDRKRPWSEKRTILLSMLFKYYRMPQGLMSQSFIPLKMWQNMCMCQILKPEVYLCFFRFLLLVVICLFWWAWVLNSGLPTYHFSHNSSPFLLWSFWRWFSQIVCPGWPQTVIFLIAASLVARFIGPSHRYPAVHSFLI
jgi:hypothetical protein